MLALNSPRWKELHQAHGSAGGIPDLIRAISEEEISTAWEDIWNSLCHQYSIYTATYAAIPHLVVIAENGSLLNRIETLILCGTIRLFGRFEGESVPDNLIEPFDSAMSTISKQSIEIMHDAAANKLLDKYPLHYLIQAILALQFGPHPSICCLDKLSDIESEVECPECNSSMFIDLNSIPSKSGDHLARSKDLEIGLKLLRDTAEDKWNSRYIVQIAGALAFTLDDKSMSETILNLCTYMDCQTCGSKFRLSDEFL